MIGTVGKLGIKGPEGLAFLTTPGDATGDDVVDLTDFNVMKENFNTQAGLAEGDFTRDGNVDLADFSVLKENFGASGPVPAPEPSSLVLGVGLVAAAIAARRLRR